MFGNDVKKVSLKEIVEFKNDKVKVLLEIQLLKRRLSFLRRKIIFLLVMGILNSYMFSRYKKRPKILRGTNYL